MKKHNSNTSSQKLEEKISTVRIITDAGIQCREGENHETVSDYAEAAKGGAKFPPLIVFTDGTSYWLADGFHRLAAAKQNGETTVLCDLRKGSRLDALKFALGANDSHGLRRTKADKRKAVGIALAEWPDLSSHELARLCSVSHTFIDNVRPSIGNVADRTRVGKDGKRRSVPPPRRSSQADDLDTLIPQEAFPGFIQSRGITLDFGEGTDGGGDIIALCALELGYRAGKIPTGNEVLEVLECGRRNWATN